MSKISAILYSQRKREVKKGEKHEIEKDKNLKEASTYERRV